MRRAVTALSPVCVIGYLSSSHILPNIRADVDSKQSVSPTSIRIAGNTASNATQYFDSQIKQSRSDPNSAINLTQNVLQHARMTSLLDTKQWTLHSNGNGPNLNTMYAFWKDIKCDLLLNQEIKRAMFRFSLFFARNEYFQFVIEKNDDQWIVYKPEQQWTDPETTFERPSGVSTATMCCDTDWSPDLYNQVKKKYGRKKPLDRDQIVEFLNTLQDCVTKTVQKEVLGQNLVKNKVFDEEMVHHSLQPELKRMMWTTIRQDGFDNVEMIPLAEAEKSVMSKNGGSNLYEDEGWYQNFVYAYMETECAFGFAQIFGHLCESDVQMMKVEYFEPDKN